jgi:HD-GYP domain-containing protein (c-di-GMP phosphodiesterase class II)
LRLGERLVEEIRVASLLHDIGKHVLPVALLDKTAPLTPEEWCLIRQHSEIGSVLAARLGHSAEVRALIRHHHEHWDGSGYPHGLAGGDTPLGARVIAIADVFDALTSPRPYRVALSDSAALQLMRKEAGTVLDPELFEVFDDLLQHTSSERTRIARTTKKRPVRFAHYVAVH